MRKKYLKTQNDIMIMDTITAFIIAFSVACGVFGLIFGIDCFKSIEQLNKRITKLEENVK